SPPVWTRGSRRSDDHSTPGLSGEAGALERREAVELASPVKALQRMDPGVLEGQPRAVEDIHDRRRDENLAGSGDGHDPSRRVNRDPPDVACDRLDLAGVDAGPDRKAEASRRVANGRRAADSALRPVALGERAVAGRVVQSSP